jgi:hypothetical protein
MFLQNAHCLLKSGSNREVGVDESLSLSSGTLDTVSAAKGRGHDKNRNCDRTRH